MIEFCSLTLSITLLHGLWSHRHKVQVLHFHWYQRLYQSDRLIWTPIKFAAFAVKIFLAHNRLGYRLTWTAHNLFPHERRFPLLDKWARWLVTHRASIVFVESETAQDVVQRTFPWIRNIEQIPQGHFVGVYPKGKPMEDARTELSIPLDAFVFLTFGLIRAYKGVETLIEAFLRELASPHCYLVIAGAPHTAEIRSAIERLAADSPYVRLKLGFIPNEEVETLFNACNVVVLPFSNIFTSSTTILACSLGRPVVIPQLGALPSSEKSGFFVYDPADPTGLLKAMCASMQADWREEGKGAIQPRSCKQLRQ